MVSTEGAVAIAAVQAGWSLQIAIALASNFPKDFFRHPGSLAVFVNPIVTPITTETEDAREGCLSLPGEHFMVSRPTRVRVHYRSVRGFPNMGVLDGWPARIIQHEWDHMRGRLISDIGQPVQ